MAVETDSRQPAKARQLPAGRYEVTASEDSADLHLVTVKNVLTGEVRKVPARGGWSVGSEFVVSESKQ